jgi:hypothetical protein
MRDILLLLILTWLQLYFILYFNSTSHAILGQMFHVESLIKRQNIQKTKIQNFEDFTRWPPNHRYLISFKILYHSIHEKMAIATRLVTKIFQVM